MLLSRRVSATCSTPLPSKPCMTGSARSLSTCGPRTLCCTTGKSSCLVLAAWVAGPWPSSTFARTASSRRMPIPRSDSSSSSTASDIGKRWAWSSSLEPSITCSFSSSMSFHSETRPMAPSYSRLHTNLTFINFIIQGTFFYILCLEKSCFSYQKDYWLFQKCIWYY